MDLGFIIRGMLTVNVAALTIRLLSIQPTALNTSQRQKQKKGASKVEVGRT